MTSHSQAPEVLSSDSAANILRTVRVLREGGVAILPTDTLYGLSASIYQPKAIERVFALKGRAPTARVPILLGSASDIRLLAEELPVEAWKLIERFWPGPLTLVLKAAALAPAAIVAGGGTIGLRVPANRACLRVLEVLGEPLVGTSANVTGLPPASNPVDALRGVGEMVDVVLQDPVPLRGLPSTVVEMTGGPPVVHRVGAVTVDEIRDTLGLHVFVRPAG